MSVLIAELVGFVVIVYVLYRYVRPPVQQMVRNRQEAIQKLVEESREAARKLSEAQGRLEATDVEARREVARLRDDARADSTRIREELQEQAEREVERIKQRGREQLAAQRDQMVRGLLAELGEQSMQLAQRLVVEALADDKVKSATVDRFLQDLDEMPARSGAAPARPAVSTGGGAG